MKTIATGCVRCGVITPGLGGLCEDSESALTPADGRSPRAASALAKARDLASSSPEPPAIRRRAASWPDEVHAKT
jgi:hypothetical protein